MKIKNAVCYSFSLLGENPMAHLRLIGPLRSAGINLINGIDNNQINHNRVYDGDIVIIQREFPEKFESYEEIIKIAHQEGKPVVFDLDDLLFFLPESHPDRQSAIFAPSLLPMFQSLTEADLVSVSTPKLQKVLLKYNSQVVVLPNYFDDNLWHLSPPIPKKINHEILTIGFMGTDSHKPDLAYITPVLLDLTKRYPQKLHFHFWGTKPPAELVSIPQVKWTSWYSNSYKEFAEFFQTQSADIFIAPLVDNLFNQCKSPLKFFEYSALGTPGVYSRIAPYEGVVTHGQHGLLASSLEDWMDCLIQLVENDELRFRLATNAQTTIRENWLLSEHAFRWKETFQSASAVISSKEDQAGDILNVVKSINLQLFETFTKKQEIEHALRIQVADQEQALRTQVADQEQALRTQAADHEQVTRTLTAQVDQARHEVEQLTAEVLRYTLSSSWRMTRPIRVIFRNLKKAFRRS